MTAKNNLNVLPVEFMLTCTFNMSVSDPPEITVVVSGRVTTTKARQLDSQTDVGARNRFIGGDHFVGC